MKPNMNISAGDIVRLRKKHPCGSDEWEVIKTGVDIRIKCLGCQRLVLLERTTLEHRIKTLVSKINSASTPNKVNTND